MITITIRGGSSFRQRNNNSVLPHGWDAAETSAQVKKLKDGMPPPGQINAECFIRNVIDTRCFACGTVVQCLLQRKQTERLPAVDMHGMLLTNTPDAALDTCEVPRIECVNPWRTGADKMITPRSKTITLFILRRSWVRA